MKKDIQHAGLLFVTLLFLCGGFIAGTASMVWATSSHDSQNKKIEALHQDEHNSNSDTGHATTGHSKEKHSILTAEKIKDFGWRIVNFIALLIILVFLGAKPLGQGLASRKKQIAGELAELEQRKNDAEKAYKEFQQKIAEVEADIDKIVARAVAQAEKEKEIILENAETTAGEMKRSAEQAIANEIAEARTILREEVAEKATKMAEEIIRKNLKAEDQKTIIDNYLAKVGATS